MMLKFQPNIQIQLSRIVELATPTITEIINQSSYIKIRSNSITKELYDITTKEIIKNDDISEKYFELGQVFVRKNGKETYSLTSSTISKDYICYYCSYPIEKEDKTCPSCKKEILRCNGCKLPISFGEKVGKCSFCEVIGHLSHFQEWIKIKGKCPTCQKKLPLEGIVPLSMESKNKVSIFFSRLFLSLDTKCFFEK